MFFFLCRKWLPRRPLYPRSSRLSIAYGGRRFRLNAIAFIAINVTGKYSCGNGEWVSWWFGERVSEIKCDVIYPRESQWRSDVPVRPSPSFQDTSIRRVSLFTWPGREFWFLECTILEGVFGRCYAKEVDKGFVWDYSSRVCAGYYFLMGPGRMFWNVWRKCNPPVYQIVLF